METVEMKQCPARLWVSPAFASQCDLTEGHTGEHRTKGKSDTDTHFIYYWENTETPSEYPFTVIYKPHNQRRATTISISSNNILKMVINATYGKGILTRVL